MQKSLIPRKIKKARKKMDKEMIDIIVKCVFTVCMVILQFYLIPWLKTKIGEQKLQELYTFIEKCVQSAEKVFTEEEYKKKKEYVRDLAINKLEEIGVTVYDDELDAIIEGFVKSVKG